MHIRLCGSRKGVDGLPGQTRRKYVPVGSTVAIQATDGLHVQPIHSLPLRQVQLIDFQEANTWTSD